jgi:hypothetical protein
MRAGKGTGVAERTPTVFVPVAVRPAVPAKVTNSPTGYKAIDRWEDGVGWLAHPGEIMRRASHALATEARVWLVDPLDAPGVDDLIAEYGDVAGVVVLSNYHARDAAAFARRYDVPVTVPEPMAGLVTFDAPVETVPVGDSLGGYELIEVAVDGILGAEWHEYGLFDGETLVVGESVGAAPYLRAGDERLGVMLLRRLDPPRDALADRDPDRVLSGHGAGVHEDAAEALGEALDNSRRRFPRALLENGLHQIRTVLAALRT